MPTATPITAELVSELSRVFARSSNKRAAHHLSRPILEQASRERRLLTESLARYLAVPESLNRGNYPVVAVPVAKNPNFELVINCWIPLPDQRTDTTTKAIHHHGDLLLSTANIFGPGYEHWLFSRPRSKRGLVHTMDVLEVKPHRLHQVAFVDAHVPHVPLYPKALSLTLALWSSRFDTTWKDHVKRVSVVQRHAATLRQLAVAGGLQKALDLKIVEYFDFFPVQGGFEAMKTRREFALGPNEDHLHSVFHVIQETGNEKLAGTIRSSLASSPLQNTRGPVIDALLGRLERGEPIEGRLSPGHYDIPFANFTARDIRRALRPDPIEQESLHGG